MDRVFLTLAATFGLTAVLGGAFGSHALSAKLTPERLATFETAVRYQLYHAFALFVVVWFRTAGPDRVSETLAGVFFIVGVVLFSGSLYALSLTGVRRWGVVTPFGGLSFLLGCGFLIVAALSAPIRFSF